MLFRVRSFLPVVLVSAALALCSWLYDQLVEGNIPLARHLADRLVCVADSRRYQAETLLAHVSGIRELELAQEKLRQALQYYQTSGSAFDLVSADCWLLLPRPELSLARAAY